ncbi:serine/threonine-protein kinase [Spatholobus suberectus]|nr:serine/threonine-protein kinase [Spatholobus suberectus]
MGCICSKDSNKDKVDEYEKEKELYKSSVQLVAPAVSTAQLDGGSIDGSVPRMAKSSSTVIRGPGKVPSEDKSNHLDATKSQHQRCMTMSAGLGERKPLMSRILSVQHCAGEHVDAGWPLWLSSVAAEAIKGWEPRRADSFEKLDQFFTTNPLPCDPLSLPKFSPSKEFDAKRREKEATRKNAEAVKGRGPASVFRGAGDTKVPETPEYNAQGNISIRDKSNTRMSRLRYQSQEDGGSDDNDEPTRVYLQNGHTHSTSLMHSSIAGPSSLSKRQESSRMNPELRTQRSHMNHAAADLSTSSVKKEQSKSGREPGMGYIPKKNRIHCSGPLMPPGGNIDDMLREHERLMQDVFRSVKKSNP